MLWKLLLMKLFVDLILVAVLTQEGWSQDTQTRRILFIWQHGLRWEVPLISNRKNTSIRN